jgi:3-oxoacyl-(acyl-carrier-protein) synthase
MKAYIRGTGNISPQPTLEGGNFPRVINTFQDAFLKATEPEYKKYIKPIQLRRMSRVLKMGVVAAGTALHEAGIEKPDAIITATGLGMMEETEKFLNSVIDNQEKLLNPTAFIQSTHNTVGAHIAVMLGCNKYNLTYVHGPVSFEAALLDTLMWLEENPKDQVLMGGAEELTEMHFRITDSAYFWKKGEVENLRLLDYHSLGTIAGEGAAFFVLSSMPAPGRSIMVNKVETIYKPENRLEMEQKIQSFLASEGLELNNIDLVLMGFNGDSRYDGIYSELEASIFSNNSTGYFKHLCGEHYLASSFAFWLAYSILRDGYIPEVLLRNKIHEGVPRNILIYNQNNMVYHSLVLLSSC